VLTARTPDLELINVTQPDGRMNVHVEFPINTHTGSADSAVVYFEIDPGERLATHTDSAEEVLYIVQGEAEATAGDETGRASAGDLVVIPAMVPHGVRNVGTERLKVVGFFTESKIVSTFEEPLQPLGAAQVEMGAPPPAVAEAA
jgi:quercetin dioxygenase-like cupin family protein